MTEIQLNMYHALALGAAMYAKIAMDWLAK